MKYLFCLGSATSYLILWNFWPANIRRLACFLCVTAHFVLPVIYFLSRYLSYQWIVQIMYVCISRDCIQTRNMEIHRADPARPISGNGEWKLSREYWTRSFCPAILKTRIIEPLFPFFSLIRRKIWTWLTSKQPLLSPAQGALSIAEVSLFCACMPLIRSINSRWGPPEC